MESPRRNGNRDDNLNDSWVELNFQKQASGGATPEIGNKPVPLHGLTGQMEKLLLEAQRESRSSSRFSSQQGSQASSRGSPKSPHSPNNELAQSAIVQLGDIPPIQEGQVLAAVQSAELPASDWIWDWSSRPEAAPPAEHSKHFVHPRHKLSVRNTKVMASGLFCLENLPTLIATHAATFFLGAAAMFLYLKKYCNWSVVAPPPMD